MQYVSINPPKIITFEKISVKKKTPQQLKINTDEEESQTSTFSICHDDDDDDDGTSPTACSSTQRFSEVIPEHIEHSTTF